MKRIAFFMFMALLLIQSQQVMANNAKTFDVLETRIEVRKISGRKTEITFNNEQRTVLIIGDASTEYNVNGVSTDFEHYIFYGYSVDRTYSGTNYYNVFIMYVNKEGSIVELINLDLEDLEEVKTMVLIEGKPIFHVRQEVEDEHGYYHHNYDYFLSLSEDYSDFEVVQFKEQIIRLHVEHDLLYVSDRYHGDYHAAIDKDLNLIYDGIIYGVVNYGVYYGEVSVKLLNGGIINKEYITHQKTLDYPGYYQIIYKNQVISFTLHPIIKGVSANQITNQTVSIDINKGHAFLNNDIYLANTIIQEPGHYELIIEGFNGYEMIIPFTITSGIEGIYNEQVYFEAKEITFNGVGFLNNRFIESGHTINESGNYTLVIYGLNGYSEIHYFKIDLVQERESNIKQTLMLLEVTMLSLAFSATTILIIRNRVKHKSKAS